MTLAAGLLNDTARDVIAILGAVGVVLTAIGVFLTWLQIKKTISANEAATRAALDSIGESRVSYHRHVLSQMSRLFSESIVCVNGEQWQLAAVRLRDLADLMTETATNDDQWMKLAIDVQSMEQSLTRIGKGEIQYTKGLRGKWHKLQQTIRTRITADLIPFPLPKEANDERTNRPL
jgi:hypothetical protein